MRYTRLRRAIESGTLIGTHGTPFQGATDKGTGAQNRRKKPLLSTRSEETVDLSPMHTRSGNSFERKTKLEDVPANGSMSDRTSEEDELAPVKKRIKLPSHCKTFSKHEDGSSESTSPVLSHKHSADSGMLCDEGMGIGPEEHPSFTASSNVDRLSFEMKIPKSDPGVTSAPFSNLEPQGSGEDPGVGDSTPAPAGVEYPQALCGADVKQASQIDTKPSHVLGACEKKAPFGLYTEAPGLSQSVKNEANETGPTPKAEKLQAEQDVKFELSDT